MYDLIDVDITGINKSITHGSPFCRLRVGQWLHRHQSICTLPARQLHLFHHRDAKAVNFIRFGSFNFHWLFLACPSAQEVVG